MKGLLFAALIAAGCRARTVPVEVSVCGALCGEPSPRASDNFAGLDCAIAARIRLVPMPRTTDGASPPDLGGADGGASLPDRCFDFQADPSVRLADLFLLHGSAQKPALSFGALPTAVPFVVEVALYAPGSTPCADPATQPLTALGRSGVIDLERDSGRIDVPLGCRDTCAGTPRNGLTLDVFRLEDLSPLVAPDALDLGEIFSYHALTSTGGVCAAPPLTAYDGSFRGFSVGYAMGRVSGVFVGDRSAIAGCVAAHVTTARGEVYACLGATSSSSHAPIYLPADAHLTAASMKNTQSGDARSGALIVRVLDAANAPVAGATVTFALSGGRNEADYPTDAAWSAFAPSGGTRAESGGFAVFFDAPTGPYSVAFADGSTARGFFAGGSDDPASVTTVLAAP